MGLNGLTIRLRAEPQDDPTQFPFYASLYRDIAFFSFTAAIEACHKAFNFSIFQRRNFAKLSCRLSNNGDTVIAENHSRRGFRINRARSRPRNLNI